ncbi:MAG: nitroreductase [Planctomycetaceae bacterium]
MPDPSDVAELVRTRRTIHSFKPDRPPDQQIEDAIELARWAPNHHHTEPWHFFLPGEKTIDRIIDLNARLVADRKGQAASDAKRRRWATIPGWLVVTCNRSSDLLRQEENYAACCCAVQNLSLVLWSYGIGLKWTTGEVTRHRELFDLLDIDPEQQRSIGIFWYGYPSEVPVQNRKPLDQILTRIP